MTANPRFALRSIVVILLIGAARVSSAASTAMAFGCRARPAPAG